MDRETRIPEDNFPAQTFPPAQDPPYEGYRQTAQLQEMTYQEHLIMLDKLLLAQKEEIEKMSSEDLKNHQLPLARVKKIMKSDEDVRMISAEAPALFAKACEMFIIELTHRSWLYTEENRRRTLQRSDIATAIARTDIFDFLIDIVPREKQ
jgi:nuclear transcription factor Y gamma